MQAQLVRDEGWRVIKTRRIMAAAGLAVLLSCDLAIGQTVSTPRPATTRKAAVPVRHHPPLKLRKPSPFNGWPVAKVEIVGSVPADRTLIENQIRVVPGAGYNRAEVGVDVRSIASLGRFSSVRADVIPTANHQVIVRYIVKERPVIRTVQIIGNQHIKTATILRTLMAHPGGAVDPFVFQTDRHDIVRMYHSKGFLFARVSVNQKDLAQGVVQYHVTEGPRVYISKVSFVGNNFYPSWFLHFKTQVTARWKLFWLIPIHDGVLQHSELEEDLSTLRNLWVKKGFLDCRTSYSLKFTPNLHHVRVQYIIHPGTRYRIGRVIFEGNHVLTAAQLRSDVTMRPGRYYDRNLILATQQRIADVYGKSGYIYSRVSPSFAYTSRPGYVNLIIRISEGNAYHVGRIIIRGNSKVEDHVVRREIRLYPGGLYDTTAVKRSISHIQDLGLFNHANITPIGHQPNTRNALVNLDQGRTAQFMIGAGVSSNAGLIGQISVTQKNFDITDTPHSLGEFLRGQAFQGNGQYFQIMLMPGTVYQLYKVTFAEPYLWDSPYSFRNSAYYFTEYYNTYNLNRAGDRVTLGRRITNHLAVTVAFRWEDVNVNNITDVGPVGFNPNEPDAAPQIFAQAGSHYLSSIKPAIVFNDTNSSIFPTRGIVAGVSLEQFGAMGGAYNFSKFDIFGTYYHTLYTDLFGRKTVLMLKNDFGFIPWGTSVFFERFYAGGIGSLRGYTYLGVTPRSGPLQDGIGGNFMDVGTAEVNFPLYRNILRGVVFVDAGDVEPNVHLGTTVVDAGIGIRVVIPFFGKLPLGINLAYPLHHTQADHIEYVSFAMGLPM
ncbi:MAG: outer membrane protein assembly factor BamA [Planctomycetia bacterium]|nr:outer membrane protein assembly factor BamA [Planctomycetia bacterium]